MRSARRFATRSWTAGQDHRATTSRFMGSISLAFPLSEFLVLNSARDIPFHNAASGGKEAMEELSFLEQLTSSIEEAQEFLGNLRAE